MRLSPPLLTACWIVAVGIDGASFAGATSSPSALPVSNASSTVIQPQPPAGSCHATGTGDFSGPDLTCTPGARNRAVKQSTIDTTICTKGYSATIRPPVRITKPEKLASLAAYGDTQPPSRYEYDHLVSLELGGAPNDPRNLWPEPGTIPNPKDRVENRLHRDLCAHTITLIAAQRAIAKHWVTTYPTSSSDQHGSLRTIGARTRLEPETRPENPDPRQTRSQRPSRLHGGPRVREWAFPDVRIVAGFSLGVCR